MRRDSDALVRTLAELIVDLTWFLESCDDTVVNPDDAVKQLEWISHKLGALPTEDRLRLITIIRERAQSETEPEFRAFLVTFAATSGLIDEDG
ncbi:hypothetical protein FDA94_03495 [Herbidospora galbida]|uniref:Uncharacterized protein n=1 Tax=Herbidospora galbida TaxID=2575442 RepID=A0A4U3MPR4_9ACTN|nr:hypothetical protein [Herbidospora galbida]TKK90839.1 hypothetical protein FDA94_03495 [Herbidospora galbida]